MAEHIKCNVLGPFFDLRCRLDAGHSGKHEERRGTPTGDLAAVWETDPPKVLTRETWKVHRCNDGSIETCTALETDRCAYGRDFYVVETNLSDVEFQPSPPRPCPFRSEYAGYRCVFFEGHYGPHRSGTSAVIPEHDGAQSAQPAYTGLGHTGTEKR